MTNADVVLDALAELVAAKVMARLAPVSSATSPLYSSTCLPPDCPSRARFHVLVKGVAGAVKRGRVWSVDADAWRAFRQRERPVASTVDDADAIIAAAGFRASR